MRNRWTRALAAALLTALAAGCSLGSGKSAPVQVPPTTGTSKPAPSPTTPPATGTAPGGQSGNVADLPGNQSELRAALAESTGITYEIVLAGDIGTLDKDTYVDNLLAEKKWPEADMMVLVVFDKANYDIRFAMGSVFNQKQVKVNEILDLVRSQYLTANRAGDTASGMASLIRAVNERMAR